MVYLKKKEHRVSLGLGLRVPLFWWWGGVGGSDAGFGFCLFCFWILWDLCSGLKNHY